MPFMGQSCEALWDGNYGLSDRREGPQATTSLCPNDNSSPVTLLGKIEVIVMMYK